jgi:hypothetical protein
MPSMTSLSRQDETGLENTPCQFKEHESRTEQEAETRCQVERTGQPKERTGYKKTDTTLQFKTQGDRKEQGGDKKGQEKTGRRRKGIEKIGLDCE